MVRATSHSDEKGSCGTSGWRINGVMVKLLNKRIDLSSYGDSVSVMNDMLRLEAAPKFTAVTIIMWQHMDSLFHHLLSAIGPHSSFKNELVMKATKKSQNAQDLVVLTKWRTQNVG